MTTTYININGQTRKQTGNEPERRFREAWTIDGDAISLDPVKQRAIFVTEVKAEAGRRILAKYPTHVQANGTARAVELTLIVAQGGTWTPEEAAEAAVLQAMRDEIAAIRTRSDALEQGDILSINDLKADATWT